MTESLRILTDAGRERDVESVVRALHRAGPLRMRDLGHQPDLIDWPAPRLEHAVVSAWEHNLIFVDRRDQLIAL